MLQAQLHQTTSQAQAWMPSLTGHLQSLELSGKCVTGNCCDWCGYSASSACYTLAATPSFAAFWCCSIRSNERLFPKSRSSHCSTAAILAVGGPGKRLVTAGSWELPACEGCRHSELRSCSIAAANAAVAAGCKPVTCIPRRSVQLAVHGAHVKNYCVCVSIPAIMCRRKSGDHLVELVFFFQLFLGSGDRTQVARLGLPGLHSKNLYLMSHLTCPEDAFCISIV